MKVSKASCKDYPYDRQCGERNDQSLGNPHPAKKGRRISFSELHGEI